MPPVTDGFEVPRDVAVVDEDEVVPDPGLVEKSARLRGCDADVVGEQTQRRQHLRARAERRGEHHDLRHTRQDR